MSYTDDIQDQLYAIEIDYLAETGYLDEEHPRQRLSEMRAIFASAPRNCLISFLLKRIEKGIVCGFTDVEIRVLKQSLNDNEPLIPVVSKKCVSCLKHIANDSSVSAKDVRLQARSWERLITRLIEGPDENRLYLSKSEAIKLGYALSFSVEEMHSFLIRATESDGFFYTKSDDLIHYYCFAKGKSYYDYLRISKQYREELQKTPNRKSDSPNEYPQNRTLANLSITKLWEDDASDYYNETWFIEWLSTSDKLDKPSESAYNVFLCLANYYCSIQGESIPRYKEYMSFYNDILSKCQNFSRDSITLEDQNRIAKELLIYERGLREEYSYPSNSSAELKKIRANQSRGLVFKTIQVEKKDVLLLLYRISNVIIENLDNYKLTPRDRADITASFIALSDELLELSILPPFYLPHPLEYSIALSTISGWTLDLWVPDPEQRKRGDKVILDPLAPFWALMKKMVKRKSVLGSLDWLYDIPEIHRLINATNEYIKNKSRDYGVLFTADCGIKQIIPSSGKRTDDMMPIIPDGQYQSEFFWEELRKTENDAGTSVGEIAEMLVRECCARVGEGNMPIEVEMVEQATTRTMVSAFLHWFASRLCPPEGTKLRVNVKTSYTITLM